ncbi:uncharacterized protein BO88DRAFT_401491 [Aspergillus vadensis CBS 113365]|uniref:Uncharacterized protein n=1 Tax=Aspergillus vadensis (strain CBS 113365 / IMI 142717 / IBT 24658) TaxID=1448311 RepID=A0A319BRU3_ASPVC|nr:hypothetical protein BO88DRAFT_401491 [Aspergillus vadensis CBS 113365]PYH73910.1 hypothetical protein BO88DRAFT_401491 [Aspergillus vadensis CBS 113365]
MQQLFPEIAVSQLNVQRCHVPMKELVKRLLLLVSPTTPATSSYQWYISSCAMVVAKSLCQDV